MPRPDKVKLEFLPSISRVGENMFENKSWVDNNEYRFTGLIPYTEYNMTVYVRVSGTNTAFVPAKYLVASTSEGT